MRALYPKSLQHTVLYIYSKRGEFIGDIHLFTMFRNKRKSFVFQVISVEVYSFVTLRLEKDEKNFIFLLLLWRIGVHLNLWTQRKKI